MQENNIGTLNTQELTLTRGLLGVRRRNQQSPTHPQLLVQMTPLDVFSRRVGQPASAQKRAAEEANLPVYYSPGEMQPTPGSVYFSY